MLLNFFHRNVCPLNSNFERVDMRNLKVSPITEFHVLTGLCILLTLVSAIINLEKWYSNRWDHDRLKTGIVYWNFNLGSIVCINTRIEKKGHLPWLHLYEHWSCGLSLLLQYKRGHNTSQPAINWQSLKCSCLYVNLYTKLMCHKMHRKILLFRILLNRRNTIWGKIMHVDSKRLFWLKAYMQRIIRVGM